MSKQNILIFIKRLGRRVFTTHELKAISGKSLSTTTQALNHLERQGLILKIYRGIWAESEVERLSPYLIIPFLFPRQRAYVSFISALHLHGIIEQIPQVITLASTSHTRTMQTKLGTFAVHQITPLFFKGFDWYKETGSFLIAEPEKALIDSLYLSAHKKKQLGYFPEMRFPKTFSFRKAREWAEAVPDPKARSYIRKRLKTILKKRT